MPTGNRAHTIMNNGNVIPIGKVFTDRLRALGVVFLQVFQCIIGQNHTPAKGIIGPVSFDHHHLV